MSLLYKYANIINIYIINNVMFYNVSTSIL